MPSAVSAGWQAGDADSGVAFVAEVHADEQSGNLLDDAGVFEFAAVDTADPGNFCCQFAGKLRGVGIVTADYDVAVERRVSAEHLGGNIVECRDHTYTVRNKFCGLLGGGTLPDADGARGPSAHSDGQGYGGIDENAALGDGGFELLQKPRLTFKGYGQRENVGGGAGAGIFHPRYFGLASNPLLDGCGRLLRPPLVPRADDDGLSRARPTQGEFHDRGTGDADNGDGARSCHTRVHANSASNDSSAMHSLSGALMWIRE